MFRSFFRDTTTRTFASLRFSSSRKIATSVQEKACIRNGLTVLSCSPDVCARRQDEALPLPFPRDNTKSQLWNEKCFIQCLRMIAIAIDDDYQATVEKMANHRKGEFKKTAIKGYGRMKNKCVSKDDHYHEPYPRSNLSLTSLTMKNELADPFSFFLTQAKLKY